MKLANNNDGQIVLGLDIPKTVSQINADIKKLEKQLAQVKTTGALDTSATVKQINSQIASLQAQLKTININANVDTNNAQKAGQKIGQTVSDTAQKVIDGKNINVDKLNADVKTLTNSLNKFSSKNAGFDTFKTDINGVEVSLDSLIQKLSTVDNNTDLSTIRSQANALKSAFTELQEVNRIQLSIDNGTYDAKIADLTNKTKQWTDANGEARISVKSLNDAYSELLKSKTDEDKIANAKKLDDAIKETANSVRKMNAELAKDSQIDSLHQKVQEFYDKNTATHRRWGNQLKDILSKTSSGAEITRAELD